MTATPQQIDAGQAGYTKRVLRVYDLWVLGFSNRLLWRCPTPRIVRHYNEHVTANHLDVGVGTGYLLDRCRFPSQAPRVALMDLNPNSLESAARRIARYQPETYRRNVLEPIDFSAAKFDSVGINYLLHCLPGTLESKSAAFDHLRDLMNPAAVLFGSTLLTGGVHRSPLARRLMHTYNRKGIFSNEHDDLAGLQRELSQRFQNVTIEVQGCAALFAARA